MFGKITILTALLLALTSASPIPTLDSAAPSTQHNIPTLEQAAYSARLLLHTTSVATLSTIFPSDLPHLALTTHIPRLNPSLPTPSASRIIFPTAPRSPIPPSPPPETPPSSPSRSPPPSTTSSSAPPSRSSSPRLALIGHLKSIPTDTDTNALQKCFLQRHPDARWWVPGNKPVHESQWVEMEVEGVFWIGGFGNVAWVGWVPLETWRGVKLREEDVRRVTEEGWEGFQVGEKVEVKLTDEEVKEGLKVQKITGEEEL
ncbi:pyridoxamine 5'-phosphate oxidase-domain-containing protein [Kalaharituber pfeilii]|nr:pyridoxamine 5'-phosphate oxidase-domain-containing protein [Kalaharituber pfeilii]